MNAHISLLQLQIFSHYELTKKSLACLSKQQLQILESEAGDVRQHSDKFSECVAAEIVRTACHQLLNQ